MIPSHCRMHPSLESERASKLLGSADAANVKSGSCLLLVGIIRVSAYAWEDFNHIVFDF